MGILNQNGQLPVGVRIWYSNVFCASGHDTYAHRMSFMYVLVRGGAWIVNIPGSPSNTFRQLSSFGHTNVEIFNTSCLEQNLQEVVI